MSGIAPIISGCLSVVNLWISIATIVYVAKVFSSASEDPINEIIISNPGDYFKNYVPTPTPTENDITCKCESEIFKGRCSEELKSSGCSDIISQVRISNNINVVNFLSEKECKQYQDSIIDKKKLTEVFNFNLGIIRVASMLILVFILLILGLGIFVGFLPCFMESCTCIREGLACLIWLSFIVSIGLCIANLVLFLVLCLNYYSGQRFYREFLECSNVISEKFTSTFPTLEELRDNFTTYMILNIISLVISFVVSILSRQGQSKGY